MEIVLWAVGTILVLNAVVAVGFTVWALVGRFRGPRRFVGAGLVWQQPHRPIGGTRLHIGGARRGGRALASGDLGPTPVRLEATGAFAAKSRGRSSGQRLVGITLAAAILCAGTAFASPRARHIVVGALGAVARGFQPESGQQTEEAAAPGEGSSFPGSDPSSQDGSPAAGNDPMRSIAGLGSAAARPTDVSDGTTAPASPTTVTAVSGSSSKIDVTWADVAGETGYRVERSSDAATGWVTIASTGQDVTSYDDAGLPPGSTWYYRVVATSEGADSSPSDVVSATTSVDPATPTAVTVTAASPSEINVTWADVAGETGYRVERSSDAATGWVTIATTGQDVTSYHDAGLPPGTTFSYRVVATTGAGDSPPSEVVSATTAAEADQPAP